MLMNVEIASRALHKLGHPTRLEIFRMLSHVGEKGMNIGEIRDTLNIPASTLNHHLHELASFELITFSKNGRFTYCAANRSLMNCLIAFLHSECLENDY